MLNLIKAYLKLSKPFLIVYLLTSITGCAQLATKQQQFKPPTSWDQHLQTNSKLKSWQLKGKLGFKIANKHGSAMLAWQEQKTGSYQVSLHGPFNIDSMHIIGDNDFVYILNADGTKVIGDKPERLAKQHLGWELPLTCLKYWIRGIPATDKNLDGIGITKDHVANSIKQAGWSISYLGYRTFNNFTVPTNILLEKGTTRLKIIVKSWDF